MSHGVIFGSRDVLSSTVFEQISRSWEVWFVACDNVEIQVVGTRLKGIHLDCGEVFAKLEYSQLLSMHTR